MAIFVEVVDIDTATKEVEALLDAKRIRPKRRADLQSVLDVLIEGVQYGFLTIDTATGLVMKMDTPVTAGNDTIESIAWPLRMDAATVQTRLASATPDKDGTNKVLALIHAYTGLAPAIIRKFEAGDNSLIQAIACVFFPS